MATTTGNFGDAKVFLEACDTYDVARMEKIFTYGIAYLGAEIPQQSKVLLKPNVLGAYAPEKHITTHPAVVEAMARLLLDNGNEVVIADSCSTPGRTAFALERTGLAVLAARYDRVSVRPIEEFPARAFADHANRYLPEVGLPRILDDVACVINLPKLKSHMLTRLTGAVKNLFGCIPGGGKQKAHMAAPTSEQFSEMLLELYAFLRPKIALNVMDAVVSLDGLGPGPTGHRNPTHFVALSRDAVAMDMACCNVTRIPAHDIWTNRFAAARGLGPAVVHTNRSLPPVRFRLPRPLFFRPLFVRPVSGIQRRRPAVVKKKCRQCGICAEVCPAKCIALADYPQWDYAKCIYCYCCHESCPHAAIKLKFSLALARE